MAVFSTNQVRHFYAVLSNVTDLSVKGSVSIDADKDGNVLIFHKGAGGVTRTDLIDPKCVKYATVTESNALREPLKKVTVAIKADHTITAGQDYILSVVLSQYIGLSDDNQLVKYGVAHATAGMTVDTLLKTLAVSLAKNLSREPEKSLKVMVGTTEVTATTKVADLTDAITSFDIEAIEQPWVRGLNAGRTAVFTVHGDKVTVAGDEVEWAEVTEGISTTSFIGDGHKIADLEYFCMGDRADVYRGMAWPHVIPTEYLIDPTLEYSVIDIHYATRGTCEDSQLSEKHLTIACDNTGVNAGRLTEAVKTSLANAGIIFE